MFHALHLPTVFFTLSVLGAIALHATAEDWPRWRGPRGDGTWQAPPLASNWKARPLPVVWDAKIGPGYSGITVVGNRVFTMDKPVEPADHERVVCLDAETGAVVWEFVYPAAYGKLDYGKGPRAAPTFHDGKLYTLGAVGHLHCLDAATGKVVWRHDLVGELRAVLSTWGFSGAVLIDGPRAIVHAGVPHGCYMAFDRQAGREFWRSGDDPLGYGNPILVEHAGRSQLIGWTPEHVLSLEPETGKENWRVPYKVTYGVSIATPAVHKGVVLVCGYWEGSKAIRLGSQPSEHAVAWEENKYLRGLMSQPLCRGDHAYLLDKQHGLVCFSLQTGAMVWTDKHQLTPRDRNPQANLMWLGDTDRALALNANGELILARLSPDGYEELERAKIIGETWAHPALAGDSVYARDDERIVRVRLTAPR